MLSSARPPKFGGCSTCRLLSNAGGIQVALGLGAGDAELGRWLNPGSANERNRKSKIGKVEVNSPGPQPPARTPPNPSATQGGDGKEQGGSCSNATATTQRRSQRRPGALGTRTPPNPSATQGG